MKKLMLRTILMTIMLLGIFPATIVCAAPPPLPDFVIASMSINSTNAVEGTPITVTVTVKNQGEVAGDGRYLDIWYNATNGAPVFGDVGDWWAPVGSLEAGESRIITSPPHFVDHLGTNQLFACIEFEDLVSEVSHTNNCRTLYYDAVPVDSLLMPVHRFWSNQFGAHFYIIGDSERDRIAAKYPGIWNYEDVAWYAYPIQVQGTEPVHRFWSDIIGKHFYIIGDSERDRIAAKYLGIWHYEAVGWYAYPTVEPGTDPIGRFWSDAFMGHFYIITQSEINRISAKYPGIWNYETIAYWAYRALPGMTGDTNEVLADLKNLTVVKVKAAPSVDQHATVFDVASGVHDDVWSGFVDGVRSLDIVYPLSFPDNQVAAYVYDSAAEQWTCVLSATNSPVLAVLENVQSDRSYLLHVFAGNPDGGEMVSVHQSWFECQLDPPDSIHENSESIAQEGDGGVGSPVAWIKTPVVDGTLTVKLYSSSQGVVKTLADVPGGEVIKLSIPEWNRWCWIGGWRDVDNELVLSIWLRQERE